MSSSEPTEDRRSSKALAALSRRFDALIAATAEIVWWAAPHQQTGFSHGWEAFTGKEEQLTTRDQWLAEIHPEDLATVLAKADDAIATMTAYVAEYRLRHRSGIHRWVEDRVIPVFDEDRVLVEWVGVISDIHDRKVAERALKENEERLRLATVASGVGVWDVDLSTGTRTWSAELKSLLGLPQATTSSLEALMERVHPADLPIVEEAHHTAFMQAEPGNVVFRIVRADSGEIRWVLSSGCAVFEDGAPVRRLGIMQDITERRHLELELENRERRLNAALRAGRSVAWERDLDTGRVNRSDNAGEVLGLSTATEDEFLNRVPAEDRDAATWRSDGPAQPSGGAVQFRYGHPDGRQLWLETRAEVTVSADGARRVAGVTSDVTARKTAEDALVRAATLDSFTGLLNRGAFTNQLASALNEALARREALHLVFLDLDSLKSINDGFGHDAGDAVVAAAARHLGAMSPPFRLAARLSGDEFAAVLDGVDRSEGERLAHQLIAAMSTAVAHKGNSFAVSASAGLASYPADGNDVSHLMKAADLALYEAKQLGKKQTRWFHPEMRRALDQRNALKAEMTAALEDDQIIPYYQPKVSLVTGEVLGFEALARWRHASGLLTPSTFGALFEDGEMSLAIGRAIRRQVLADTRAWLDQGLPIGRIAINCSGHEFRSMTFAASLLQELACARVPTSNFEVEVTEDVVLGRGVDGIKAALDSLHRSGVKLSLDDFGTGYASLLHLQRFPVDEIKLDRSFIAQMTSGPNKAIIQAVVTLGINLGLSIVAEGVETGAQADGLREIGCDRAQGYLFGKPMNAERVPWFIRNRAQVSGQRSVQRQG